MLTSLKTSLVRAMALASGVVLALPAPASAQDIFALFQQGFGSPTYSDPTQGPTTATSFATGR